MGWLSRIIATFFKDMSLGAIDYMGKFFSNIFYSVVKLNNTKLVETTLKFTIAFSVALLALIVAKQLLTVYGFQSEGDSTESPDEVIMKSAIALALIASSTWIFDFLLKFSKDFTLDLTNIKVKKEPVDIVKDMLVSGFDLTNVSTIMINIIIIAMIVALIVFSISAGVRGATLILMKIIFPIVAVDYANKNRKVWSVFITFYLSTFFTFALQLLCFKMFMINFALSTHALSTGTVAGFGWLILAIKTPAFFEQYIFKSGIGSAASAAARTAGQAAIYLA